MPAYSQRVALLFTAMAARVGAQTTEPPPALVPLAAPTQPAGNTAAVATLAPLPEAVPSPSPRPTQTAVTVPGLPPPPPGYRYVPVQSLRTPAPQPKPASSWEDGDLVPNGYHVREEPRRGLVTAGYIVTAIPYGISAMAALSADFKNQSGYLLLPFVGPWMTLGRRNYGNCDSGANSDGWTCLADAFVVMGLVTDGIMQVAGGTLLLTGYLVTSKRLVHNSVSLTLRTQPVGTGYGFGASGTF